MPVPYQEIAWIKDRLDRLEKRLDKLEAARNKSLDLELQFVNNVSKHFDLHRIEIEDLVSSVVNLEHTVFPNLRKDLRHLHRVIGNKVTPALNPLDHRPLAKKSPKSNKKS
jgi:hypothetical protein